MNIHHYIKSLSYKNKHQLTKIVNTELSHMLMYEYFVTKNERLNMSILKISQGFQLKVLELPFLVQNWMRHFSF